MEVAIVKRSINSMFFFVLIVLFSLVSLIAVNFTFNFTDEIYSGVMVGNISVGGLSTQEAREKISAVWLNEIVNSPIIITYNEQQWEVYPKDIELDLNVEKLANDAHDVGRVGNVFYRLHNRYVAMNHSYTLPFMVTFNADKLSAVLSGIAKKIGREPQNAVVHINNGTVVIDSETVGVKVDVSVNYDKFVGVLNSGNFPVHYSFQCEEMQPAVFAKDLEDIETIRAVYTTEFDPASSNRVQNIRIAAKSINQLLLHPGETFSFNKTVGLRSQQNGYKEAPAYVDGKLVLDWGGGVCQVTSTLYNAAVLADMMIEDRTPHPHPPNYVPLGQDSTVADELIDFKFKNTSSHCIYINSEVTNGQVSVYILGRREEGPEVGIVATEKRVIEPGSIVKRDPELELGKQIVESDGQRGFIVTTYRVKKSNGKEISRELLSTDEYKQEDRVVRVGTKILPNTPPTK